MIGHINKLIVILIAAATLSGCSEYNKLLKSKDHEAMYLKAIEYHEKRKFEKSQNLMEEIAHYYTGTTREDTIMYYWGSAYYKNGDFSSSEMIFDRFRRQYGRSPFLEDVEYMYAMGFYFRSPSPDRDQTETVKAIKAMNEYLQRYPGSIRKQLCQARLDELNGKLYDKAFINARSYYKIGRYKSAVIALRNALSDYPDTPHREEILYLTTKSSYELATNSVTALQRDRYLDMVDSYYTFVAQFPDSKHRKEMDRMLASARKYLDRHQSDVLDVDEESRRQPDPISLQQR